MSHDKVICLEYGLFTMHNGGQRKEEFRKIFKKYMESRRRAKAEPLRLTSAGPSLSVAKKTGDPHV